MTELVREYDIPIDKVFVDTKAGLYIKIYDIDLIRKYIPIKEEKLKVSLGPEES